MNKTKVMIVDDEIEILDILKTFLSKDYDVITAVNGLEAMAKFSMETPQIIITDINMPHMSGMELLKTVKEMSPFTEVILITGFKTPETSIEAQEQGAFECIAKPVSILYLNSLLQKAVDKINSHIAC